MQVNMTREQALKHLQGQRELIERRLAVLRESISELDQDWGELNTSRLHIERALLAIIRAQLIQLRSALAEGEGESAKIDEQIKAVESPIAQATLIGPHTGVVGSPRPGQR